MKQLTTRTRTYLIAGGGLLALVLLAISLNGLQLAPGQPVSFQQLAPQVSSANGTNDLSGIFTAVFRVAMIIFWILVPVFIILILLDKEARRRFLRSLALIVPLLLLLYYFSSVRQTQNALDIASPSAFNAATLVPPQSEAPPPPAYTPPASWVTNLATGLIAGAIALVVVGAVFTIWRRWKNQQQLQEPLSQVQREAQAALEAIYAGGDLRETILRCYVQMVEALKQYRGISREYDMTPHEFELYLEKRGLPREPVRQLTQLFEQVRYGAAQPGRQEERMAINSLSAIINAIQQPRSA